MKQTIYSLILTALFGITGMQAWADGLSTTEIDGVTYYEIKSGEDLLAFAELVNDGEPGANAVLTAEIDMSSIEWDTPIGVDGSPFTGIFDGQGHKVTGLAGTSSGKYGLLGYIYHATVKNFSISGTIDAVAAHGTGAIGWSESSSISNVHSSLVIEVTEGGVHHVGGVVGSAQYNNRLTGCTFSGTLTEAAGNHDCFGGVVGYMAEDTLLYCANYGTVTFTANNGYVGGIAGYLNNTGGVVKGCLNLGTITYDEPEGTPQNGGGALVGYLKGYTASNIQNNYWLEGSAIAGNGTNTTPTTVSFTADQLPTGAVCYGLNGDQSVIGWYQTLGTDQQPTLDATHAQVYMNGRLHCNGDAYTDATYSNEYAEVIQDDHNIVDGFCTYCGLFDENYLTPNADGYYEIATAKQLVWFEMKVNKGELEANAILTADIDFADLIDQEADPVPTEAAWTPIGDWGQIRGTSNAGYKGHFDGQGHKILNFNVTSNCNYYGVFGVISEGSLIENFDIYGILNLGHKTGGVVGYTRDTACTIRNIHSFITLNVTEAATTAERPGGILGTAVNGTTNVENCTYSGILNAGGHTGNIGGIVGYVNNNSAAIVNITNCLFDGEIQNGSEADGQCGGIVGYNNGGTLTVRNCLTIGEIVSSNGNIGQFIGRLNGSNTKFYNSYYVGEFVNGTQSGKTAGGEAPVQVTSDELASGETCWELNGETFIDVTWHQLLGDQAYPVPYGEEGVVYQTRNEDYKCISDDPNALTDFINDIIARETDFLEDMVAYQELIDAYKAEIESWENIENLDEFFEAYQASAELKESIKTSAANYAAYVKACEKAAQEVEENSLQGETTDILKTYLEENVEPSEDEGGYPNGSYIYIIENLNLDDEAIIAEIAFVNKLLENAVAADGIEPGKEISRLFANISFADGFEGWTYENDGITLASGGTTEIMPIVRGLGNGTFNVSQTVTDLPDGIYMVAANALFRSGSDATSKFYAGQLYLNNTYNYIMSPIEDYVSVGEAEDGVNCLISSDTKLMEEEEIIGYVPNNMNGSSYAFNAGRYENFSATEVTDGSLTVGVRSLGTGLESDWLPFGNMHIFYLGSADEADEKLATVLEGFKTRAQSIVDFESSDDNVEFAKYPNFSEKLKGDLEEAIGAVEDATSGAAKMELINIFSDLFNQIHAQRKAYIAMLDAAYKLTDILDNLNGAGIIDDQTYDLWWGEIEDAQGHFDEGDIDTEGALALAEKLNNANLIDLEIVDDYYQLATAEDVQLFSIIANNINTEAKAVLTADIDMGSLIEEEGFESIGTTSHPFAGEFDGQNHKISNFGQFVKEPDDEEGYYLLMMSGTGQGFFGSVNGATIKNFSIDGAFEVTSGKYIGAIGEAVNSTISNVHSSLVIDVTASGVHHTGGVVGSTEGGSNTTITNCSFSGTLKVAAGSTDNFAGVVGYLGGDRVMNCANYGSVIFSDAGCAAGGVAGYLNNTSTYIQNCLNVGTVQCEVSDSPKYGGAIIGRIKNNWSADIVKNNYWLEGSAYAPSKKDDGTSPEAASAQGSTATQMASGEICYKLNGDQEEINWYQSINFDLYPVLFPDHEQVFYNEAEDLYYNLVNDVIVGIGAVESSEPKTVTGIYNLAGQRLEKMQKGINIVNGRKVLVK